MMAKQDKTNFKESIFSFYKFITPVDMMGATRIREEVGPDKGKSAASNKTLAADATELLMSYFIENAKSGKVLTTDVKLIQKKDTARDALSLQEFCKRGFFKAIYQECGSSAAETPDDNGDIYFTHKTSKDKETDKPKLIVNFYDNVVGGQPGLQGSGASPNLDFTVATLRAPMLTLARRHVKEIELYLNSMPPIFANQLVPYCDVEFQIPLLNKDKSTSNDEFVNRPSLYRFLMGSGQNMMALTEADKSLAYYLVPDNKDVKKAQRSLANGSQGAKQQEDQKAINKSKAAFFGMEMFTTPQTLSNINTLRAGNISGGGTRLNDAKPFLPPATITAVGITTQNAGANTQSKTNASLNMVIHDKARLAEFAEFVRGQSGYNEATVWITYGMLAPRNRGSDDYYAKFINENMLRRQAFTVSNVQYSFNGDGSISITLTMGLKGGKKLSVTTINFGGAVKSAVDRLKTILAKIKENLSSLGKAERTEKNGFSQKEIRFVQVVEAAAVGALDAGIGKKELSRLLDEVEATMKSYQKQGNKSYKVPDLNPGEVVNLINTLKDYYGYIPQNANTGSPSPKESLRNAGVDFAKNKLELAANHDQSPDPFFPVAYKNKEKATLFTKDFIECCTIKKPQATPQRRYVSFGKLFLLFCAETIIDAISQEFAWSKSMKDKTFGTSGCPYEVQFLFYQLNRKCGPASGHNIAEFPMDITMFTDAFGKYIEGTGGDAVTIENFIDFLNTQLSDVRQPGYGRKDWYKEYDSKKPGDTVPLDAKTHDGRVEQWHATYGPSFVMPQMAYNMEICDERISDSNVDLLSTLGSRVGGGFTDPDFRQATPSSGKKTIIKFHIYDQTASPYGDVQKEIRKASTGDIFVFDSEELANQYTQPPENPSTPTARDTSTIPRVNMNRENIKIGNQIIAVNIGTGKSALKQLIGEVTPVLDIGAEGTLISSINLASKTDGLQGTLAMQGGTQRAENTLTSNGLSQEGIASPMIVIPAQLTMTTMGCPIANPYQQFFVDLGTNTTIDNVYTVTQLQHSFSPGKYETQWTFGYLDGYPRFINPGAIDETLKEIKNIFSAPLQSSTQIGPAAGAVGPTGPNGPVGIGSARPGRVER